MGGEHSPDLRGVDARGSFRALFQIDENHIMKYKSRYTDLVSIPEHSATDWAFLTNHARVLVRIAHDPGIRLRDVGEQLGITERAAHRIVTELTSAGYLSRERDGRRNSYTINAHLPLPDAIANGQSIGQLLTILTAPQRSEHSTSRAGT